MENHTGTGDVSDLQVSRLKTSMRPMPHGTGGYVRRYPLGLKSKTAGRETGLPRSRKRQTQFFGQTYLPANQCWPELEKKPHPHSYARPTLSNCEIKQKSSVFWNSWRKMDVSVATESPERHILTNPVGRRCKMIKRIDPPQNHEPGDRWSYKFVFKGKIPTFSSIFASLA